ncbi:hypothetical protein ACFQO1_02330 [Jejudonia soesokkakensis]|uniref:Membrane or secreted protein n=1 Tax=Jejudonia soesokkakensis TaxID=1323432 RepID=A0ABW2MT96_9FLAO
MKKVILLLAAIATVSFTSCREKEEAKTETEQILEDARAEGADIEIKDGGDKIKIEEADGDEIKIKTDDGDLKIKTDDNN